MNEMSSNDRNKVIAEVADWIKSHGSRAFPAKNFCGGIFEENAPDDYDFRPKNIQLVDSAGNDVAVNINLIHLLVAVALDVDKQILGEMSSSFKWDTVLYARLRGLGNIGIDLFGKRINHTDMAIAFLQGLMAHDGYLIEEALSLPNDPQREIAFTHINRHEYWLGSRLNGYGENDLGDDPTTGGDDIPFKIRCLEHCPDRNLSTLIQRLGGFSNNVVKYKVERYGQWEAMISSFFWAKSESPETVALRKAFIDLAEGPFGAKFLHALGSITANRHASPDEVLIGMLNLKAMAGKGSVVYKTLEDPVVIANTECILPFDFSVEFQVKLLDRLATYDQAKFGIAQVDSINLISEEVLASHGKQVAKLVANIAFCLEGLGDKFNDSKDEATVVQLPEKVMFALTKHKSLLESLVIKLTKIPGFDFPALSRLPVAQQECLALVGVDLKHFKKVGRDVKGQILMSGLGL
jgi:hypothetical protein